MPTDDGSLALGPVPWPAVADIALVWQVRRGAAWDQLRAIAIALRAPDARFDEAWGRAGRPPLAAAVAGDQQAALVRHRFYLPPLLSGACRPHPCFCSVFVLRCRRQSRPPLPLAASPGSAIAAAIRPLGSEASAGTKAQTRAVTGVSGALLPSHDHGTNGGAG